MAVQFILGRSGTGKTHACIEAVCDALVADPNSSAPLILLVPEQATFQMERAVLSHAGIEGFSRCAPGIVVTIVCSFCRLTGLTINWSDKTRPVPDCPHWDARWCCTVCSMRWPTI